MLKTKIKDIFKDISSKKICVIGDLMLDIYLFGDVKRISPEAPVQVFERNRSEPKLGGAANVGLNIVSLGAKAYMLGVIGNDDEGKILLKEFKKNKIETEGIIKVTDRPTTSKTRVIASSNHLLRLDAESKAKISTEVEKKILSVLKKNIKKFDIIILQDYNKGVLTKNLIQSIIKIASANKVRVLVDPKFDNFFEFENVFAFKPNRKELEDATGKKPHNDTELNELAVSVMKRMKIDNLILTLGESGIRIFEKSGRNFKITSIPTRARKVADVSGAGDTVISTIAVCLAGGSDLNDAVQIANFAAGMVVEEVGIVPVFKEALINNINGSL